MVRENSTHIKTSLLNSHDNLCTETTNGSFSLQLFVINLKPSTHHLPRLALLFAGGVIFVYLM